MRDAREPPLDVDRIFAAYAGCRRLGLAVSGGSDSTALMHLFAGWAAGRPDAPIATVLTVDHGLRPASRRESDAVVASANALGLAGECLVWHHQGVHADLQAAARRARYALLADAARRLGLGSVLIAHTRDDVAETFLIRLSRGSGVAGLAAMRPSRHVEGIRFDRPLIGCSRAMLRDWLASAGVRWFDDPSNASPRFLRARMRAALPGLAALGLTLDRLAGTAGALADARDVVEDAIDALDRDAVTDGFGWCEINVARLCARRRAVGLGLLARLIRAVRPADYPPRHDRLAGLWQAIIEARGPFRRTLSGTVLSLAGGRLTIAAEAGRAGFPTLAAPPEARLVWDGRLMVTTGALAGDARLAPLDASARRRLADAGLALPARLAGSLPMLQSGGETLLPLERDPNGMWRLVAAPSFAITPLSARFAEKKPRPGL